MLCGCFPVKGTGQLRYIDEPTVEAMYYKILVEKLLPSTRTMHNGLGWLFIPPQ